MSYIVKCKWDILEVKWGSSIELWASCLVNFYIPGPHIIPILKKKLHECLVKLIEFDDLNLNAVELPKQLI